MKTVLLTGASTGLGLAIAERLFARPLRLVLTARSGSMGRFAEAGIEERDHVWLRPLDVTSDAERRSVIEEIDARLGGVDILINNAGVSYRSVVEHVRDEDRLAQMDVNFRSPMELARLVLPGMREKCAGHIINVSSVGGMMAMPTMAAYSASKFALEGASEALYYEVKPWNIHVTLVQPGFINSTSFQNVRYTPLSETSHLRADDPYYAHYRFMEPFIARMMGLSIARPERVARVVERVMHRTRPPLRVSATPDAAFFALFRRLLPRGLYHYVLYRNLPNVRQWGPNWRPDTGTPPPAEPTED